MYFQEQPENNERYVQTLNDSRKAYSRLGVAVAVLFGVYLVSSYVLVFASAFFLPNLYVQWWFSWVLNLVPLYLFALPSFYLVLRKVDRGAHDTRYASGGFLYEKPKFHVGHFCLFALICFGLMYIGSLMGNRLMSWMSQVMGYDYENNLNSLADNSPWWMLLLGTVIIAPIGEELMFRKLFIDRARRYGDGMAIILSALLFALFHGNFFQFFYAFMVGLVMAYVYTLTGKLYWSVGLHMFMNFMGMMVIPNLTRWFGLEGMEEIDPNDLEAMESFIAAHPTGYALMSLVSLLIYAAMAAAVVLIIYHIRKKKIYVGQGELPLRPSDRALSAFGNVGILVCIFLLCLFMVLNLIPVPAAS